METTPLLVKKNDDKKIFYRSAKYILLSCVFVLLATFAVTTTTSSSPSSERMMVRMKGYASRAAAPLFLRGRSTTTSSLDAAKLGEESATPSVITLSAACSPVDKLSFDPGNWENVGAKLISKTMSSDFAFENGIEMNAVKGKCGEYEVSAADLTSARSLASFCTRKRAGTESRLKILDANLPWMGALIVQHTLHRKNRPSVDRFRWLRARRRLLTVIYHFTIESTTDLR